MSHSKASLIPFCNEGTSSHTDLFIPAFFFFNFYDISLENLVDIYFLHIRNRQNTSNAKVTESSRYFFRHEEIVHLVMTRQGRVVRLKKLESFMDPAIKSVLLSPNIMLLLNLWDQGQ